MRLDHVALAVSDRDRSAAFYGEFFELTERVHDDEHLLILANAAGDLLALSDAEPPSAEGLPRTHHFGFRVTDAAAIAALRERFATAGVREAEFSPDGPARVQVFDPDGYRVEAYAF